MSDKVFPSTKPANTTAAAATNGTGGTTATTNGGPTKANLYNPTSRPPYRRPSYNRRQYHRPRRNICCRCCFWSILILLIIALLASIAGIVLYVMYRPHRPSFSIPSLRVHRLNLTTSADSSSSHVSTLFNFTLSSKNPNSHISFFYDPFAVSCISSTSGVFMGNGTIPAFVSNGKNLTTFRAVIVSTFQDLDADSVNGLRSDLKKKGGVPLKLELDTRVKVKLDGLKSKKVGIRVTCEGIKADPPTGKSPALANTSGAKCKVDLRIKIWKWTF
ncbi:hypothetical protein SLA2020_476160 [Shorea laevis]